ncbi:restriction endonuclease subunit S [Yoonia maritima]|uniref:restriction endonuclease subunit S n=1 Tax=Yoonia maritima TaxID=1435347 RepID=UPI000D0F417B|nr:restriction endonuclease subunit S [Yoonia maritima]
MMEWATVELAKVADLTGGHAFKSSEYSETGMAVLRTLNIRDDCSVDLSDPKYIPHVLVPAYERFALQKDDTLFVMVGATLGKVGLIRAKNLPALLNQNMWRIRAKPGKVDPMYLHYCFRHFCIGPLEWMSGSARGFVRRDDYRTLEIPLPSRSEQQQIAAILGALDNKIELNRRMSATLEEMARALYRSWFVDFDPVHARALGQSPAHMDPTTAALFPDSFGPDGLPKGWASVPLLDVMELISGGTPKTSEPKYWGGDIPWASAKDVSQCGQSFLIGTERSITRAGLVKSSTKIVPKFSTVVVARGATTGRACMFGDDIAMNQTCYALQSRHGRPFFANCLFMNEVVGITLAAHGSVFDTITTKTLQATNVTAPTDALSQAFEELVSPMFLETLNRTRESQTLATLRDTLLPRLMSGNLRIREAEKQVEEVVSA